MQLYINLFLKLRKVLLFVESLKFSLVKSWGWTSLVGIMYIHKDLHYPRWVKDIPHL